MDVTKVGTVLGIALLGLLLVSPVLGGEAVGIPDAPAPPQKRVLGDEAVGIPDAPAPPEKRLANQTVHFPGGFATSSGRQFPQGVYELTLIESAGRYYLRLTNVETRAAIRLAGRTTTTGSREMQATVLPAVSVRPEKGGGSLLVTHGEVTASFPVRTGSAG